PPLFAWIESCPALLALETRITQGLAAIPGRRSLHNEQNQGHDLFVRNHAGSGSVRMAVSVRQPIDPTSTAAGDHATEPAFADPAFTKPRRNATRPTARCADPAAAQLCSARPAALD